MKRKQNNRMDGWNHAADRNELYQMGGRPTRGVCPKCRKVFQQIDLCGSCKLPLRSLGLTTRAPKVTASKRVWKKWICKFMASDEEMLHYLEKA